MAAPSRTKEELMSILDGLDAIEMQGQSAQAWQGLEGAMCVLQELIDAPFWSC